MKFEETNLRLQVNDISIDANTTKSSFVDRYEYLGAKLFVQNNEWESYIINDINDEGTILIMCVYFKYQKLYMVSIDLSDAGYSQILDDRLKDLCINTFGAIEKLYLGGNVACAFDAKNCSWSIVFRYD